MAPRRWLRCLLFISTFTSLFSIIKVLYASVSPFVEKYDDVITQDNAQEKNQDFLDSILQSLGNVSNRYYNNSGTDVGATLVVLVTYQRTGSSFLAELFNHNPDAFVWFEPMDAVYSALFGTAYGYNVPSDIWNHANGSDRILTSAEKVLLARTSTAILTCNFEDLATEVLIHHFIMMFIDQHRCLAPYAKCALSESKSVKTCRYCNTQLARVCSQRFDPTSKNLQMCANELAKRFPGLEVPYPGVTPDSKTRAAVNTYYKCMEPCRKKAFECLDHLKHACFSAKLRSIKPVRLNMEIAHIIKHNVPQVKLIHNLRDPRGVVHSRKHTSESFQSSYAITRKTLKVGAKVVRTTDISLSKEASLFCRNAAKDCLVRKHIQSLYPEDTLQVMYESYASQPHEVAAEVYGFVGHAVPDSVTQWLTNNTAGNNVRVKQQTSRQANETLARWQHELTVSVMKEIDSQCQDLYAQVDHAWPYS